MTVSQTFGDTNKQAEGKTGGQLARERGTTALDAILDVVIADDLRTGLDTAAMGDDLETWRMRAETWRDPRVLVGGSDAGAHVDIMCGAVTSTVHLGTNVRDRQLLTLEEAVHQLTDMPARLYGIRGRGRVAPGYHADLMVFDADRVGPGPVRTQADLPAGAARLVAEAIGVAHVFVNGTEVVVDGRLTGDAPGTSCVPAATPTPSKQARTPPRTPATRSCVIRRVSTRCRITQEPREWARRRAASSVGPRASSNAASGASGIHAAREPSSASATTDAVVGASGPTRSALMSARAPPITAAPSHPGEPGPRSKSWASRTAPSRTTRQRTRMRPDASPARPNTSSSTKLSRADERQRHRGIDQMITSSYRHQRLGVPVE